MLDRALGLYSYSHTLVGVWQNIYICPPAKQYLLTGAARLGIYDILLLLLLPVMGTGISYVSHPKWKAFITIIPVPFTLITLSLGRPVGAYNMMGLILLLGFSFLVKILYQNLKVPIIPSILLAAAVYLLISYLLKLVIHDTIISFTTATFINFLLAVLLYIKMPYRDEPKHKSPIAVWKKFSLLLLLSAFAIVAKSYLGGFMTAFPLVSMIGFYESRTSIYTLCRHLSVMMLAVGVMIIIIYLLQNQLGLATALSVGLAIYFVLFGTLITRMWKRDAGLRGTI